MHVLHISNDVKRLLSQLFHFPMTSLRSNIVYIYGVIACIFPKRLIMQIDVSHLTFLSTYCSVYNIHNLAYSSEMISTEILCFWENCVFKILQRKNIRYLKYLINYLKIKLSKIFKVYTAIILFSLLNS